MNVQPPKLDRESAKRAVDRVFVQFRRERAGKQIARFALEILQRRLKFADRRVARTQDRVERDAGLGFAAMAFDLQPPVPRGGHRRNRAWLADRASVRRVSDVHAGRGGPVRVAGHRNLTAAVVVAI